MLLLQFYTNNGKHNTFDIAYDAQMSPYNILVPFLQIIDHKTVYFTALIFFQIRIAHARIMLKKEIVNFMNALKKGTHAQ